jgi:dolichol kinase
VAFQSFVVLVFIWLGDGSRLNKSCLHDLGVPYHHCYRVSSPLLEEFISVLATSKEKKKRKKSKAFYLGLRGAMHSFYFYFLKNIF